MLLIVTDAHLLPGSARNDDFRAMLRAISASPHDVLFLGDIMELWMAIPRYETPEHAAFLEWCRSESARRKVFFVEGNHEFQVSAEHRDCFTEVAVESMILGDCLFCHGACIQEPPWGITRLLLRFFRTRFVNVVLRIVPGGSTIINTFKRLLGSNGKYRNAPVVPEQKIRRWLSAVKRRNPNLKLCFLGHFHTGKSLAVESLDCHIIPPWKESQEILLLDTTRETFTLSPWKALL